MDKYPISASSLEKYYYIDGHQLERQYKEHLSDYLNWKDKEQGEHADKWLVFPQNVAPRMSIDETSLSDEELYPDIENAYNLTDELRRIYSSTNIKGGNWHIGISMWKMRDTIHFKWSSRPSMKTI